MIEKIDKNTGAVIITPSEEMLGIERIQQKLDSIEKQLQELYKIVKQNPTNN